jgi:DNA-binding response OmpR family regulator
MRLLLAEDDPQLRRAIVRGRREAAYAVEQAADGLEADALARTNDFDAVVLDILMPGMDGLDVCRANCARGSAVPILMLTALDAVEHRITGLDAGADDYLVKPFDLGELLARLRALTRRQAPVLPATLAVGDLVLDTAAHSAPRHAGHSADGARVRLPRAARAPRPTGREARRPDDARLGRRPCRPLEHHRRLREPPLPQGGRR